MLLHKSDTNVVIANILVCRHSLYDLTVPKCKNLGDRQTLEKGLVQNALIASSTKCNVGHIFKVSSREATVKKSLLTRKTYEFTFRLIRKES